MSAIVVFQHDAACRTKPWELQLMARQIARFLGFLFLLAGFAVGLIDGTRSIAAESLDWMSFGGALNWLFPERLIAVQDTVTRNIHPFLWDPVITTLLLLPALIILFTTGMILLILAGHRARL
jgi:hypothetical protein